MLRLPYHVARNLGLGSLLLVVVLLVGIAYQSNRAAVQAFQVISEQITPIHDYLESITEKVGEAQRIYIRDIASDRPRAEDVVLLLDGLADRLAQLEKRLEPLGGAVEPGALSKPLSVVRASFFAYVEEDRLDPTADTNAFLIERMDASLALTRSRMMMAFTGRDIGGVSQETRTLQQVCSDLLVELEQEVDRYAHRDRTDISDAAESASLALAQLHELSKRHKNHFKGADAILKGIEKLEWLLGRF